MNKCKDCDYYVNHHGYGQCYGQKDAPKVDDNECCTDFKASSKKPVRKFEKILARYVPEDLCTYPEYRGKPYYSIQYEENGEHYISFGTYNPDVLSGYLREYFFRGGNE